MVYAPGMSDTSSSDPPRPGERVSTAIRTVPNAVTLARLLLLPLCAYLLATGRYGWGIALTAVVGSTDWVDGWLARRTGQVSRLGQLLDPPPPRPRPRSAPPSTARRGLPPMPRVGPGSLRLLGEIARRPRLPVCGCDDEDGDQADAGEREARDLAVHRRAPSWAFARFETSSSNASRMKFATTLEPP